MGVRAMIFAVAGLLFWQRSSSAQAASDSQQIQTHSQRAQEYLATNKPDLAIVEFQAILALDPNDAAVLSWRL